MSLVDPPSHTRNAQGVLELRPTLDEFAAGAMRAWLSGNTCTGQDR